MNHKHKLAMLLSAVMVLSVGTACGDDSSLPNQTPPTTSAAETLATVAETQPPAEPETDLPQAETTPENPEPADEPAESVSELVGKWEVESLDGQTVSMGQYGCEDYCRICQMEILADGTVIYYDRGDDITTYGTWAQPAEGIVQLLFGADQMPYVYPLGFAEGDWTYQNGTLTAPAGSLGDLVIRKTEQFTERAYPDIAWLSGEWHSENGDTAAVWNVYTVEQSVVLSVTEGGDDSQMYFGQVQDDRSILLVVDIDYGQPHTYENTVIRRNGDKAEWIINANGLGTVTMVK